MNLLVFFQKLGKDCTSSAGTNLQGLFRIYTGHGCLVGELCIALLAVRSYLFAISRHVPYFIQIFEVVFPF